MIVTSPCAGWLTPIAAVPDPVFAERMLGDGVAIDPAEGRIAAPIAGTIHSIHAARHAVTIESDDGALLLVHIGLETVALGGAGFTALVAPGDRVAAGAPLIAFDMDAVGRRARSLVTPIVLTNGDAFAIEAVQGEGLVAAGEPLFTLVRLAARETTHGTGPVAERGVILPLRHGLHARPAARLSECARGFDATAVLIAADGREAPLTSPVGMLALALPHGARLTIRATGPDAQAAVAAIADLIESGMGEGAAIAAEAPPAEGPLPPRLTGIGAAPGLAIGPAWAPPRTAAIDDVPAGDVRAEAGRLTKAVEMVRAALVASTLQSGAAAAIAEAHLAFLDDSALRAAADRGIAGGHSAGAAWNEAIEQFARLLGGSGDKRFVERVDDLRDLALRVQAALSGGELVLDPPPGAVLIGADVLPSQLMALADKGLAGIASGGGGATSHAAIIAAGLGLPMVAALGPEVARIAPGTPLLIDGGTGLLEIDPSPTRIAERRADAAREADFRAAAQARGHEPAITADGTHIHVYANLGSVADAKAAVAAGAEGCGLLRTEFVFLERSTPPDEEEQRALYQAIADALAGRPLIVRTLDIGADKPAPWLPMAAEENPALGLRGLRIGLQRPDLLRTQLRALVQVVGQVSIMLPMVIEPAELAAARAMLIEEAEALGRPAPPLGVMVETPAAALLAKGLAREAAFLSIGTNDLSQYALAMDRTNPAVAVKLDALHPAVLRLIAETAKGGAAQGRWTGVCGGLAADPVAVPLLIGLGITELSVPPAQIAAIKAHVRACDLDTARGLAARALTLDDAAAVRALVGQSQRETV